MSDEPHGDAAAAVSRRLDRHQRHLAAALADILDPEAGLREILLQSRHDAATEALDTVLDTEAGLAAILPVTDQPASSGQTETGSEPDHMTGEPLVSVNASTRLALRKDRSVAAANRSLSRDRRYVRELNPDRAAAHDRHLSLVLALGLARDVSRDLVRLLDRLTKVTDSRDDVARAHHQQLVLSRRLARAVVEARDLELPDLVAQVRSITRTPLHDRVLSTAEAAPTVHPHDLVLMLAHAQELDHELDAALSFAHLQERADDNTFTCALIEIRTNRVRRALEEAIGRELPRAGAEAVHEFLNDFTRADLRQVNLTDTDLQGISWSEYGTQWPPGLDVEGLKRQSEETPPGSNVWTVRSGTTTVGSFAAV
ncbi:hypothetical protein [Streptomyces sp. NPDC058739]|uniref:hypothetical protein n=1 Tax=Streptomyces sp. NPDC058739 TaxID=3346618 RepID=UPI0036AB5DE9